MSELQENVQENIEVEDTEKIIPEGDCILELDVLIKSNDLFDYFLRHVYCSFSGLFSTIIGVLMIGMYAVRHASPIYLICGVIVIFYLPVNLFMMAKRQALQESFKTPFHYAFYDNCMEVSQGDIRQCQEWDHMVKAISTGNSIIVYTGKNAASIFPRRDLGENAVALIKVISTHMPPNKVKIKE